MSELKQFEWINIKCWSKYYFQLVVIQLLTVWILEADLIRAIAACVHWLQLHEEARVFKAIICHVISDSADVVSNAADVVGLIAYGVGAIGWENHLHRVWISGWNTHSLATVHGTLVSWQVAKRATLLIKAEMTGASIHWGTGDWCVGNIFRAFFGRLHPEKEAFW